MSKRKSLWFLGLIVPVLFTLCLAFEPSSEAAPGAFEPLRPFPPGVSKSQGLQVKVLKACEKCVLPDAPACQSKVFHQDKAAIWVPNKNIKIHAVSIPEQSEVSIYADIEVSTASQMYLPFGHIFRVKYAGPGILRNPPCPQSFLGSNITTTNIVFPNNHWIRVAAGTPIYVHMDVINWSPFTINPMAQDVYIYYEEE